MATFLYNCFLFLYSAGARAISPWSPKAALWVKGRKDIFNNIEQALGTSKKPRIWIHCASLGEFEQGRPVLERIRALYPSYHILISFFSPSGYEIRKNYKGADFVCYLPMDSKANARKFLNAVQPSLVLWVKYEYWFYYLSEIKKRNIPLLLISGIFRDSQPFFKWYGNMHREMLHFFTQLFVQTNDSRKKLGTIGLSSVVTVSGDTRFDRVTDIAGKPDPIPVIEQFCGDHPVIVAGSTWPEDEEEMDHYANNHPEIRFIIAPHEISEDHIKDIERLFKNSVRFSQLAAGTVTVKAGAEPSVLIIDNIGMLSRLYFYADITYVGGGFGDSGLHNILEAAVYGKPVIFGPVHEKFFEAVDLVETGGAFSVENALELENLLNKLLNNPELLEKSGKAALDYVYASRGATDILLSFIQENRLLTN